MSETPEPESAPSFESALEQLQSIVHDLEEGRLGLEESLVRFEDGMRLLGKCYQVLELAEQRIEILTGVDGDGNPLMRAFDATATIDGGEAGGRKPVRRRAAKPAPSPPRVEPAPVEPLPVEPLPNDQRLF